MKPLRGLVVEVHRRSLWQVLAIFVAAGWAVLQAIDVLIQNGVLPAWVFKGGLVLLLLGLPVVLATAFIQEGPSETGEADTTSQDDSSDLTPSPRSVPVVSAGLTRTAGSATAVAPASTAPADSEHGVARPAHHRLFTWRNAILGGVCAFALLGLVAAAYMGMRTLGIGAPGTLLAQGVIDEGAPVVLAEFESVDDNDLGSVVTGTLRVDLMQSRTIRLLDRADLRPALERMHIADTMPITSAVATQLAEREGHAAVIAGRVAPLGSGYVLTANIMGGDGFRPLAAFRETARDDSELVDAVERLSRSIRDKLGESLRSIRSGPPLAQVTTASLPALRAYTRGQELDIAGDLGAALEHYERAVALDSTFAMAYRKIAVTLNNLHIRSVDGARASRRAYELSERLPEHERHLAVGWYHTNVSGDVDGAVRAYEQAMLSDSANPALRNSLANTYVLQGKYADAARLYAGASSTRRISTLWFNLALARYRMGDYSGAVATVDSMRVAVPERADPWHVGVVIAAAHGDYTAADSLVELLEKHAARPLERVNARQDRYLLAATRGRLREAEGFLSAPRMELFMADSGWLAYRRAAVWLLRGDTAGAVRLARDFGVVADTEVGVYIGDLIHVLAEARAADPAAELLAMWQAAVPEDEAGIFGRLNRDIASAQVARVRRDFESALATLERLHRLYPGVGFYFSYQLGRVYDDAGQADRAISEYERSLTENEPHRFMDGVLALPHTLRRLAELYDARGDSQKAATYYARFIDLWEDADPELQPQVRTARDRLTRLTLEQR